MRLLASGSAAPVRPVAEPATFVDRRFDAAAAVAGSDEAKAEGLHLTAVEAIAKLYFAALAAWVGAYREVG